MAEDFGEQLNDDVEFVNVIPDRRFTVTVKQIYEREITENFSTPVAAAHEANISTKMHNSWIEKYESFRAFIFELQQRHLSKVRKLTNKAFFDLAEEEDPDPKTILDMGMKFLKNTDQDFGTQKTDITVSKKEEVLPDVGDDDDIQQVIKEAEKAANSQPKEENES